MTETAHSQAPGHASTNCPLVKDVEIYSIHRIEKVALRKKYTNHVRHMEFQVTQRTTNLPAVNPLLGSILPMLRDAVA
eukprot:11543160-Karenia_brevis.AAC.1